MDSKTFLAALRTIIREEVTKAVRNEVGRVLTEGASHPTPVERAVQIRRSVEHAVQTRRPIAQKPKFKNPMLNQLLEGVAPAPSDEAKVGFEEWPTMQYAGNPTRGISNSYKKGPINAAPEGVNIAAIERQAPEVAAALTRDYRSLVKAMLKPKA